LQSRRPLGRPLPAAPWSRCRHYPARRLARALAWTLGGRRGPAHRI